MRNSFLILNNGYQLGLYIACAIYNDNDIFVVYVGLEGN